MCRQYRRSCLSTDHRLERFADDIAEQPHSRLIHVSDLSVGARDEDRIRHLRDRFKFRVVCSNSTIKEVVEIAHQARQFARIDTALRKSDWAEVCRRHAFNLVAYTVQSSRQHKCG